jgi:hypothetical protein
MGKFGVLFVILERIWLGFCLYFFIEAFKTILVLGVLLSLGKATV